MTATMAQANEALRTAVRERLAATPQDDHKMATVSCCEGGRLTGGSPMGSTAGIEMKRIDSPAGSTEWLNALERLRALHYEKTAQYGGAEDAFENVSASQKCGVEPWQRALCDLSDCVVRMQKYAVGQPVDPTNALLDAANWALICLIKMEEQGRDA
jgi:hypothetical protein